MSGLRRMGRRRADRLLDGGGSPCDPLEPWLSAARAGAVATEFTDEERQLAQFRASHAARAVAAPAPRRRITRTKTVAAVVAGAVAAVTGVAVAGAAGVLPARFQRPAHNIFHAPAPASTSRPSHSPGGSHSSPPPVTGTSRSATATSATSAPTRTASPSVASPSPTRPSASTPTGTTPSAPGSDHTTAPTSTPPTGSAPSTPGRPSRSRNPSTSPPS